MLICRQMQHNRQTDKKVYQNNRYVHVESYFIWPSLKAANFVAIALMKETSQKPCPTYSPIKATFFTTCSMTLFQSRNKLFILLFGAEDEVQIALFLGGLLFPFSFIFHLLFLCKKFFIISVVDLQINAAKKSIRITLHGWLHN